MIPKNPHQVHTISAWFNLPLGKTVVEIEAECVNRLLPQKFYRTAIQLGGLTDALIINKLIYKVKSNGLQGVQLAECDVVANAEFLPFSSHTIDLLVLPHVLEFSPSPHEVLREVAECVVPEGIVVISGFNPYSLFGIMKLTGGQVRTYMDRGKFYSMNRIRDWLALLEFDVLAGEILFYRPPLSQVRQLDKFKVMESFGERWWPYFGSIYVLVAQKKERGMRLNLKLSPATRLRRKILGPVAENSTASQD